MKRRTGRVRGERHNPLKATDTTYSFYQKATDEKRINCYNALPNSSWTFAYFFLEK